MSKSSGGRRYLALFFPWLPAERLARTAPRPPDAPLVFADRQRGALRIASVDPAATWINSYNNSGRDYAVNIGLLS